MAFIANEEGWRVGLTDRVYIDFAGKPTIGYGHLVQPGEKFREPMTHAEALELLAKDLARTEKVVNERITATITQNQFDALVSLVFNIGPGHFRETNNTALRKLNAGDVQGAADAFLLWNKATIDGKMQVSATLARRRKRERDVFLKPEE